MWSRAVRSLLFALGACLALGVSSAVGHAATFVVNSGAEIVDADTSDGLCKTAGGACTLRAAIQQVNASGGNNRIEVPPGTYLIDPALGDLRLSNATSVLTIVGTGSPAILLGPNVTYLDGQDAIQVFDIRGGTITLENLSIQHGRVDVTDPGEFGSCVGAGVYAAGSNTTVNIKSSFIRLNKSLNGSGAGICVGIGATVTVDRSYVAFNQSTFAGGGIRVFPSAGGLQVTNSTIYGNQVTAADRGGGGIRTQSPMSIVNSTISNNGGAVEGSGLLITSGTTTTIANSTIAFNGNAPQIFVSEESHLTIESTIVEGVATCAIEAGGVISSLGHNLESENTCGFTATGDLVNALSGIQFTESNGGTPAFPLPAGSPAIDAGSNPLGLATDQRGFPRAQGARSDIGAYEAEIPERNLTGLWWALPPGSESGWGINFEQQANGIFATWFTYGQDGKPLWLAVFASLTSPGVYKGELFATTGPPYNAVPFDPDVVVETTVGTATFTVGDDGHVTFDYSLNLPGTAKALVTQTKTLVRQSFGPLPVCSWSTGANPSAATNYTGLWWNIPGGSESGWGINFTQQGEQIFATWFTYDLAGKPWWLAFVANPTGPGIYTGDVFTTTGPALNAVPFNPASVVETTIGTATLTFTDGNAASFSYTINGVTQVKSIQRQLFFEPLTLCQ